MRYSNRLYDHEAIAPTFSYRAWDREANAAHQRDQRLRRPDIAGTRRLNSSEEPKREVEEARRPKRRESSYGGDLQDRDRAASKRGRQQSDRWRPKRNNIDNEARDDSRSRPATELNDDIRRRSSIWLDNRPGDGKATAQDRINRQRSCIWLNPGLFYIQNPLPQSASKLDEVSVQKSETVRLGTNQQDSKGTDGSEDGKIVETVTLGTNQQGSEGTDGSEDGEIVETGD
ncbi:MAG: hypothetical protein Q9213_002575, partial [Squamulea squamosa]